MQGVLWYLQYVLLLRRRKFYCGCHILNAWKTQRGKLTSRRSSFFFCLWLLNPSVCYVPLQQDFCMDSQNSFFLSQRTDQLNFEWKAARKCIKKYCHSYHFTGRTIEVQVTSRPQNRDKSEVWSAMHAIPSTSSHKDVTRFSRGERAPWSALHIPRCSSVDAFLHAGLCIHIRLILCSSRLHHPRLTKLTLWPSAKCDICWINVSIVR